MNDGGLQISPSELKFKFELSKLVPTKLSLYNPSSDRVAFTIKTTQPKRYNICPSAGFVEPNANINVKITLQSSQEYPSDPWDVSNCKDEVLVQHVSARLFGEERAGLAETKLKAVFDLPFGPPGPIPKIYEIKTAAGKRNTLDGRRPFQLSKRVKDSPQFATGTPVFSSASWSPLFGTCNNPSIDSGFTRDNNTVNNNFDTQGRLQKYYMGLAKIFQGGNFNNALVWLFNFVLLCTLLIFLLQGKY
eukprot:TRINITY_DN3475_c0_g1_i1.p2 TRINITY_DN3475_c0_g1~~TRINITY_DN3475_c0_g1_i1.p2  ORF type:complete len:247 (-),score=24.67 TRINITY_DN3475_c0_g1_i1:1359-2099(-)